MPVSKEVGQCQYVSKEVGHSASMYLRKWASTSISGPVPVSKEVDHAVPVCI